MPVERFIKKVLIGTSAVTALTVAATVFEVPNQLDEVIDSKIATHVDEELSKRGISPSVSPIHQELSSRDNSKDHRARDIVIVYGGTVLGAVAAAGAVGMHELGEFRAKRSNNSTLSPQEA